MTAGQGEPLGINAKFASGSPRVVRFALQSVARRLLPSERVSSCLRVPFAAPEIWYSPSHEKAHYKRLVTCGSVWTCPVCASKITERRKNELSQALAIWPGSVFMVTFTFQHSREDKLGDLVHHLVEGIRELKSGRSWMLFESVYQLAGSVKGFENTWSIAAGWHPHVHILFFSMLQADQLQTEQIELQLSTRFGQIMNKAGRYVSGIYGVKVEKACNAQDEWDQALKKYVAKWGLDSELAKSPVKTARDENGIVHYNPFQLLALAGQGDKQSSLLFVEYAQAMKGVNSLRWSRGLRKAIGLQDEKTDDELAKEAVSRGDELLARLTSRQWGIVLANDARAELLDIADSGDPGQVWRFLSRIGVDEFETIQLGASP